MTSPVRFLSNFKGKFKIPNDDKILRICLNYNDLSKFEKGKRDIFLYEEGVCINHNSDEVIYSPEYAVEYTDDEDNPISDEEIISSFHSDDVEFI